MLVPAEAILAEGTRESNYQASHWMLGVAHRLLEEAFGSARHVGVFSMAK